MIELKEWDYNLLKRLEDKNMTDYRITEIRGEYYINQDDLFTCLDDTSDYRDYAEQKLVEVADDYDNRLKDDIPSLEKQYLDQIEKLKARNKELEETLNCLQSTLNEEGYNKLSENGYEYYIEKELNR